MTGGAATKQIPSVFKWGYLLFLLVLVPVYAREYPLLNFLWFSNIALIGGLIASFVESRRLASMLLIAILLPQTGWILDFTGGLLLGGNPPLGMVTYMFDPTIPLWIRGLSLYHFVLPFALFWLVWRLGYDRLAWRAWIPLGWLVLWIAWFFSTPESSVNWVMGPWGEPQPWMPPLLWMLLLMAGSALLWWISHLLISRLPGIVSSD